MLNSTIGEAAIAPLLQRYRSALEWQDGAPSRSASSGAPIQIAAIVHLALPATAEAEEMPKLASKLGVTSPTISFCASKDMPSLVVEPVEVHSHFGLPARKPTGRWNQA